jgi:hypothetical protein
MHQRDSTLADRPTVNDTRGTFMTTNPEQLADRGPTVKMLLDGNFIQSKTSEWHDVVNPATQEVLAQVPNATDDEINAAVASSKERSCSSIRRRRPSLPVG